MQLTSCQHRLEHIARIHAALGLACADNGMQFVNEQDNLSFTVLHILQHRLQTFLKFSPVFGAGNQRPHIQGKYFLILQPLGNIPPHNPLCQAFHNRRLADTGFPDKHRIIFRLSGEDTDDITDLRVSANHRIQLLVSGLLHQILAVFFQRIVGGLRVITGHPLIASHCGKRLEKTFSGNAVFRPDGFDFLIGMLNHAQEQMLHRNIFVAHLSGFILCGCQNLIQLSSHIDLAALYFHTLAHRILRPVHKVFLLDSHFLNQLQYQAVFYGKQAVEQMFFFNFLVAVFIRQLLAALYGLHGFLCKFGNIHTHALLLFLLFLLFYLFYYHYNNIISYCQLFFPLFFNSQILRQKDLCFRQNGGTIYKEGFPYSGNPEKFINFSQHT